MLWIDEYKGLLRVLVLGLLVVALLGPWVFDLINVPAQYACSPPFVRLEGDYCGTPLSGVWLLFSAFGLLLLPIITTAVLLLRGDRHVSPGLQMAAFGLALGLLLLSGFLSLANQNQILWGARLYAGVAAAALVLEGAMWAGRRRAGLG